MRLSNMRLLVIGIMMVSMIGLPAPVSRADTFHPVVRGRRGVVAGGHPLSVEAGLRILQRGGNAVDAGVATIRSVAGMQSMPVWLRFLPLR